jgi:AraC-like DNA-binding protein
MRAWHEKNLFDAGFPFRLFTADDTEFPPHWHEEIEIVYALRESLTVGVNSEVFPLEPRDILLIGQGEVHYFLSQPRPIPRIIIQFTPSIFESAAAVMRNRRFITPLIRNDSVTGPIHHRLEAEILAAATEYRQKSEGYHIAIKARLFDLAVILLRQVPTSKYAAEERSKQLRGLERLEIVFHFIEANYTQTLTLPDVAAATGFSIYHFARFFKELTGMTFIQYYNNLRIAKVVNELNQTDDSITAIALRSGFNSIPTFNRVFKQVKGCSPSHYKKECSRPESCAEKSNN